MDTENNLQTSEKQTPKVSPGTYSPVTVDVRDSLGVLMLGIISIILLFGWMKAEARNRQLLSR